MGVKRAGRFFSYYLILALAFLAGAILLGAIAVRLWDWGHYSWFVLHYPYQIDFDEGINMHAAWTMAHGRSPYLPLDPNYFVSAPYPPLFYAMASVVLRFTGLAFWTGRLISLLATLGIAALLGLMAARATRHWILGVLGGLFFLSLSPVYVWSTLYKHDMVAILFTVAGLCIVQRWAGRRSVYWAVPLFALAFFTKQTALIGPAVAGLYLFLDDLLRGGRFFSWKTWRRAVFFGLACLAAIAVPFLLLDLFLHHNLYLHTFTFQMLPWTFRRFMKNMRQLGSYYGVLIGLAVAAAGLMLARRKGKWRQAQEKNEPAGQASWSPALLFPLYLLVAYAAIVVSNGYEGGNYNHLLDLFPPLCLLLLAGLGVLWEMRQHLAVRAVLLLAAVGLLWQLTYPVNYSRLKVRNLLSDKGFRLTPPTFWYRGIITPEEEAQMARIYDLVRNTPGPILSEDVGILLLTGHEVEYEDPSTFTPLARYGLWDDSVLADKIARRRYSLVLLEYDITNLDKALRWTPTLFGALKENYRLLYPDFLFIYEPKGRY